MKIIAPSLACLVHGDFESPKTESDIEAAIAQGYQQIYIQTPEGFYKHHILRPGKDGKPRFIRIPVKEIPGVKFKKYEPLVNFLPDGKIPYVLLQEVKAFFNKIIQVKKNAVEAMIWVLWSQEKGYYLHVPNQIVSHTSARYEWDGVPADSSIIVDIHSHADFGAFFSGPDNGDDANAVRYSGVIGHNNTNSPSSKWRFNYFGTKFDLEDTDIFASPPIPEGLTTPDEWVDKVQTSVPNISQTGGKRNAGKWSYMPNSSGYPPFMGVGNYGRVGNTVSPGPSNQEEFEFPDPSQERTGAPASSGRQSAFDDSGLASPRRVTHQGKTFLDTGNGLLPVPTAESQTAPSGSGSARSSAFEDYLNRKYGEQSRNSSRNQYEERTAWSGTGSKETSSDDQTSLGTQKRKDSSSSQGKTEAKGEYLPTLDTDENEDEFDRNIAAELAEALNLTADANLGEESIDKLHQAAMRQAQEDILSDQAEEYLTNLEQVETAERSRGIEFRIDPENITPEFDTISINHGKDVATAYAIIENFSGNLINDNKILSKTVEDLFQLIDDAYKLASFRNLVQLLPKDALEKLAQNGL